MAMTVAPAAASPFASANPIPRDAPVTIAVLATRENRRDTSNSSAISRFRSARERDSEIQNQLTLSIQRSATRSRDFKLYNENGLTMSTQPQRKVFFEPVIGPHSPRLYEAPSIGASVPFSRALMDDSRASYDADGFLVVSGVLNGQELARARNELEGMTLADDPNCEAICYEGAIRRLLPPSEAKENVVTGKGVGDAL